MHLGFKTVLKANKKPANNALTWLLSCKEEN